METTSFGGWFLYMYLSWFGTCSKQGCVFRYMYSIVTGKSSTCFTRFFRFLLFIGIINTPNTQREFNHTPSVIIFSIEIASVVTFSGFSPGQLWIFQGRDITPLIYIFYLHLPTQSVLTWRLYTFVYNTQVM